jgi:hypothetical protein
VASGRREAGHERIELVVQPLAQRLERQDQLTAVRDGRPHRLDLATADHGAPCTLAREPHQRGTVPIIGLEPPRPQLRPRRLGLRRRKQPQRPRPPALELGHPRTVKRSRRLECEHDIVRSGQPLKLLEPIT